MKAVVWTNYGPPEVLQLREVETPVPKDNQVRIKIHATTVTAGDCEMRKLQLPMFLGLPMRFYAGILRPRRMTILGQELSGEIESIGSQVTRFSQGDRVCAAVGFPLGGYAQYICLPERSDDGVIGAMPGNMGFEEAAAVPFGGLEALHFLRKARIRPGEKVLVNGAGGSIGTFGVQLAKYYGAEVAAVDSEAKLEMLTSIGADQVIDYARDDFTQSGQYYDVIFDVIGKSPFAASLRSLNPGGRYVLANPRVSDLLRRMFRSGFAGRKVISGSAVRRPEDWQFLKGLIEAGKLRTVIDRVLPLEQMVEAHRYVETGQKLGNLIISVAHD